MPFRDDILAKKRPAKIRSLELPRRESFHLLRVIGATKSSIFYYLIASVTEVKQRARYSIEPISPEQGLPAFVLINGPNQAVVDGKGGQ